MKLESDYEESIFSYIVNERRTVRFRTYRVNSDEIMELFKGAVGEPSGMSWNGSELTLTTREEIKDKLIEKELHG